MSHVCRPARPSASAAREQPPRRSTTRSTDLREMNLPNTRAETDLQRTERWDQEERDRIASSYATATEELSLTLRELREETQKLEAAPRPGPGPEAPRAFEPAQAPSPSPAPSLSSIPPAPEPSDATAPGPPDPHGTTAMPSTLALSSVDLSLPHSDAPRAVPSPPPEPREAAATPADTPDLAARPPSPPVPPRAPPTPESLLEPMAPISQPGPAPPPRLWHWTPELAEVLPQGPAELLPPGCGLLQRTAPLPGYALVPVREVTVERLRAEGTSYRQVVPPGVPVHPYVELWPGADESHVREALAALRVRLEQGLNCYVQSVVVLTHPEGSSLPAAGAPAAPGAAEVAGDAADILYAVQQLRDPSRARATDPAPPVAPRGTYALHLTLEEGRGLQSYGDWALFVYQQLHNTYARLALPPGVVDVAQLLALAREAPLLALNPKAFGPTRAFRLPLVGEATALRPADCRDPGLAAALASCAPPDAALLQHCLIAKAADAEPPPPDPDAVQVPRDVRFRPRPPLPVPLPPNFRDDGDHIPSAIELRDLFADGPGQAPPKPKPVRLLAHREERVAAAAGDRRAWGPPEPERPPADSDCSNAISSGGGGGGGNGAGALESGPPGPRECLKAVKAKRMKLESLTVLELRRHEQAKWERAEAQGAEEGPKGLTWPGAAQQGNVGNRGMRFTLMSM